MKRISPISLTAVLVLVLTLTACGVDSLIPKALASDTKDIAAQVKVDSADVFAEIQQNVDLVTTLKAKMDKARLDNKPLSLNDAIKDIQTVTQSYEKLAGQRDEIRQGLLDKITNVKDMKARVDSEIHTLQLRRAGYVNELSTLKDPNPDIVATRQKALMKAIAYVDGQIQLWVQFNTTEQNIVVEMSNVQQQIDSFLSVIDSSATLFREGLNLLLLQRDINEALSLFTSDIPKMQQLTQDMQTSWDNLDYLIKMLTSISLNGG